MRRSAPLLLLLVGSLVGAAQPRDAVEARLAQRLYPLASTLQAAAQGGPERTMLMARAARIAACADDMPCTVAAAIWQPPELELMTRATRQPEQLRRELIGANELLRIYGMGATPRYPQIDGPWGSPGTERFIIDLRAAGALAQAAAHEPFTSLDASIGLSLALLDVNNRLDAIAFEPLDGGLNAAAFRYAGRVRWAGFPYTAIIVLGAGPEDLNVPLSALGKLHVRRAAERFLAGDAPFIICSGAAVHPKETQRVEAVEMRRALIERYGIPESAILIEPYARHTTTNLRNATRLLLRLHAPLDRDALVLSNPPHIDSVGSTAFVERNQRELGFMPGSVGRRTSPFTIEFRPAAISVQVDPLDPLDP
ncbi:MAG: YdcF family protein [Steroidobacteraceae bacterium]